MDSPPGYVGYKEKKMNDIKQAIESYLEANTYDKQVAAHEKITTVLNSLVALKM